MKNTCKECPFRKDSIRGWLSDYTIDQLHNLVMSEIQFPCHMQMGDEDIKFEDADQYPVCEGSIKYMKKSAKMPRNPVLLKMVQEAPKDENILSATEFRKHHDIRNKY